jgi:hypothetical protein
MAKNNAKYQQMMKLHKKDNEWYELERSISCWYNYE